MSGGPKSRKRFASHGSVDLYGSGKQSAEGKGTGSPLHDLANGFLVPGAFSTNRATNSRFPHSLVDFHVFGIPKNMETRSRWRYFFMLARNLFHAAMPAWAAFSSTPWGNPATPTAPTNRFPTPKGNPPPTR